MLYTSKTIQLYLKSHEILVLQISFTTIIGVMGVSTLDLFISNYTEIKTNLGALLIPGFSRVVLVLVTLESNIETSVEKTEL